MTILRNPCSRFVLNPMSWCLYREEAMKGNPVNTLRKAVSDGADRVILCASPEAFDYQQDVTVEGIQWMRSKVAKYMKSEDSADDEWVVIDGYRGSKN